MARPISWLPRLDAIRQSVGSSVRSHYNSGDLQRLFEVQPRSAQLLLEQLPTVRIGKSLLVERETLAAYLDRVASSADPARTFAALRRQEKPAPVRRKLRVLVQKDVDLSELPANVELQPGALTVRFASVEELAASLMRLAQIMQYDLDRFAVEYMSRFQKNETNVRLSGKRKDSTLNFFAGGIPDVECMAERTSHNDSACTLLIFE